MRLLLDKNWELAGFWPFTPLQGASMETGALPNAVTPVIEARVPGSVCDDLLRAGLLPDPYYERNSLLCEWVPNRFWVYRTRFTLPEAISGRRMRLVFRGIDYHAHILLNGQKIAEHTGMYVPCTVDVSGLLHAEAENTLVVILEQAPDEMGQIGYTSRTRTQKARFTYKWDFSTRLIHLGLYDTVYLEAADDVPEDVHIRYLGEGELHVTASCRTLSGTLSFDGETVASAADTEDTGTLRPRSLMFHIEQPHLWWPNGYGEQPLYALTLTTADDAKTFRVGLRTLSYRKPVCDDPAVLPYIPVINGRDIYIKGVNMVPLDHMYGAVPRERYRRFLDLAQEAHVNLIRVWGGGLIEKEDFYELCDERGLLVWQEFIQSSSGIDNMPSEDPVFLDLLARTARAVLPEKRNHVCLTFWSGGNELMDASSVPVTYDHPTIALLRSIVQELSPEILLLPTSASGPTEWADDAHPSRNHDIHGPWKYEGTEGHYALYNRSTMLLHSEFGVDGMASMDTLRTILAPENRRVTDMADNLTWRHHGEWWDTYAYRERPLFGPLEDLETLVTLSQFLQGEGIRYAVEAHRRRSRTASPARMAPGYAPVPPVVQENIGSIVWQFNEPWPTVSCTCLVDYYGHPKPAFRFFRDAHEPRHLSLRYDKLLWTPGEIFTGWVYQHDDTGSTPCPDAPDAIGATVTVQDDNGRVLPVDACGSRLSFPVPDSEAFTVTCTSADDAAIRSVYLFLVGTPGHAPVAPVLRYMEQMQK